MKYIVLIFTSAILSACSHTINFRANHFAVPVVGDTPWSGTIAGVGTSVTKITVINDINSNPPLRSDLYVNGGVDAGDVLLVNNLGLDASISPFPSLEVYYESSLLGVRWQFLNHGPTSNVWVAAVQGAYCSRTSSTSDSGNGGVQSTADSKVKTSQIGGSVGYKFNVLTPYFSYIRENHSVETTVTNSYGTFGGYKDTGAHDYYSLGVSTTGRGFLLALEYSMINIKWDRSNTNSQNAVGGKIGFAW